MADLYSTLGVARGADEASIKKAYRKLAKELHPDRNTDNPKAAARFSEVTQAYDLLMDKDKRAQYDRGEIDEQGNPKMPFGFGGQRGGGPGGFRPTRGAPGGDAFDFGDAAAADFGDIFEGIFGASRQPQSSQRSGFSGFGGFGARAKPQKGADVVYPGGPGDATVSIEVKPHRFFTRDGDDVRLDLPVRLDEAVLGARIKLPTVEGAVMMTIPEGSTSGKVLRLKGRGFHKRGGGRGDQLVTLMVDLPADDEALKQFAESWTGDEQRNPRANLGV
ncbi:MAG: DnaJ domain-containing protein [Sphingomonas sp.]|nr:DnaJ domain-containing protein [Sphingomonas sp.]